MTMLGKIMPPPLLRILLPFVMIIVAAALPAGAVDYPLLERVSVPQSAPPAPQRNFAHGRVASTTGRYVVYTTLERQVTTDNNSVQDVYVRDLETNVTELASKDGAGFAAGGYFPSISGDGCRISFVSQVSLALPFSPGGQVYVRDRCASPVTITRASVLSGTTTPAPGYFDEFGESYAISGDGRHVLFEAASDLDGAGACPSCIYVHDLDTGKTTRMNVSSNGTTSNAAAFGADISNDGRIVTFASGANNLVGDDTDNRSDAFVHDRDTDEDGILDEPGHISTVRVSVTAAGGQVQVESTPSMRTAISGNGLVAAFNSRSNLLVPGDTNPGEDIFVRVLANNTLERFGREPEASPPVGVTCCHNKFYGISDNGSRIAFTGSAQVTTTTQAYSVPEAYVGIRGGGGATVQLTNAGYDNDNASEAAGISGNGLLVVVNSQTDFTGDDAGDGLLEDVYAFGVLVGNDNDLLIDFGSNGLYQRMNNATWLKVHNSSPIAVASGDLDGSGRDEAIASFSGLGLWARYNNAAPWVKLHNSLPTRFTTGDLDGDGKDEVIAAFPGLGLYARYNNAGSWVRLHGWTAEGLATGDLDGNGKDELIADFGASGFYARYNSAGAWVKLHASSPTQIAVADPDGSGKDEVIAAFPGLGLYARYNNAGAWVRLHGWTAEGLATGDLDGNGKDDLLVDFGASGLYARYNNVAPWVKLHANNPLRILAADLDNSGRAEAIASFPGLGVWARYNNAGAWRRLHAWAEQGIVVGGFD